jgi:hypothetical protein
MSEEHLEEILRRLDSLEQRFEHAATPRADEPIPDDPDPNERRFVDLLVGLVTENVDQLLRKRIPDIAAAVADHLRHVDLGARGDGARDRGRNGDRDRGRRKRAFGRERRD